MGKPNRSGTGRGTYSEEELQDLRSRELAASPLSDIDSEPWSNTFLDKREGKGKGKGKGRRQTITVTPC